MIDTVKTESDRRKRNANYKPQGKRCINCEHGVNQIKMLFCEKLGCPVEKCGNCDLYKRAQTGVTA